MDVADLLVAGDAPPQGPQWHEHGVVLVRAPHRLPLGRKHSDDLAGKFAQPYFATQRVLAAEELFAHCLSDDAYRPAGSELVLRELPARGDHMVSNGQIVVVGACNCGVPVQVAVDGGCGLNRRRGHGKDPADIPGYRLDVLDVEGRGLRPLARAEPLARPEDKEVAAGARDPLTQPR